MTPPKKPSRQDILRQQQQTIFVGREAHLDQFRYNLKLPPESWRFLFNVWGQGGVGKSTLLRQFRKLAEDAGCITALTTDSETSVPEAMGRLAEQLAQQGHPLEAFAERYKVYRQKKQELEADPEAPQGFSAFLGKSVAKAGLGLAKQIPGSGAVTPFLDEEGMTSQAGEWASYVARKLGNKDEVRLVNEPVEVLTPLFLQGLEKLAEQTSLVLFFDVYERTADFLDRWLREILESRYGDLPLNLIGVIAGREELDRNHWADYETAMIRIPLNPFTEAEAIQYLDRKDITNPQVVDVILRLSGCLPLLVATLAAESPNDPDQIGDPSGTAVERFLKWVDNPKYRQVALDAALPRILNRDVIAVLHGEEDADELFNWLREMPFVEQRIDGWAYHNIARTQMLRHKRLISPHKWIELHSKLADYYNQQRKPLQLTTGQKYRDIDWQNYKLESFYHSLCQAQQNYILESFNVFLASLRHSRLLSRRYAEIMCQASQDIEVNELNFWGKRLISSLDKVYMGQDKNKVIASIFTDVLEHPDLETQMRAVALFMRGDSYRLLHRHKEALKDLDESISLDSEFTKPLASRGSIYHRLGRYEDALRDLNKALELDPKNGWTLVRRGWNYKDLQQYNNALKDFNRAIELNPQDAWAIASKGETYYLLGLHEEAREAYNQAVELIQSIEGHEWILMDRGVLLFRIGSYEKALEDLNRVIASNSRVLFALVNRGVVYLALKNYEAALSDLTYALDLNPKNDWCLHYRALTYLVLNQSDNAKADFDRAIQIAQQEYDEEPEHWNNTFNLALYHLAAGNLAQMKHFYQDALNRGAPQARIQAAIQDLEDLLRMFPEHEWAQKAKAGLEQRING
ncbi:MAG: tetratricopeptide repeat protein [Scytolyngbya sp. HA4215-MV1]|jgi:tetratricopeptide (TPR) repeat protein|nr:tetratricopeptide repeat protein [Scytolyngbya sp. HA4215-MV1]